MTALLSLEKVTKTFATANGPIDALRDVDLAVGAGETVGLVGESGSGKSTLARIAMRLVRPDDGRVLFYGADVASLRGRELLDLRSRLQMVFQEPYESLDPRMPVYAIVEEPLRIRAVRSGREREQRVRAVLDEVGISWELSRRRPRELSGGQQQRVGIARALVSRPRLVVLDEPTSALDLSIRAGILRLLGALQAEHGLSYLMISHDLPTVSSFTQRVAVLRKGEIVEQGPTRTVISAPQHEYTKALLDAQLKVFPVGELRTGG